MNRALCPSRVWGLATSNGALALSLSGAHALCFGACVLSIGGSHPQVTQPTPGISLAAVCHSSCFFPGVYATVQYEQRTPQHQLCVSVVPGSSATEDPLMKDAEGLKTALCLLLPCSPSINYCLTDLLSLQTTPHLFQRHSRCGTE